MFNDLEGITCIQDDVDGKIDVGRADSRRVERQAADLERDFQREAGARDEYVEGVRAFLEKRPADFRPVAGA